MPCNISCPLHNNDERGYDITAEGRIWPCCFFANAWDKRIAEMFRGKPVPEWERFKADEKLMQYFEEDPDFNNLEVYNIDKILQHPFFLEHAFYPGWESDKPPVICEREFSVKQDTVTGKMVMQSSVDVRDYI